MTKKLDFFAIGAIRLCFTSCDLDLARALRRAAGCSSLEFTSP